MVSLPRRSRPSSAEGRSKKLKIRAKMGIFRHFLGLKSTFEQFNLTRSSWYGVISLEGCQRNILVFGRSGSDHFCRRYTLLKLKKRFSAVLTALHLRIRQIGVRAPFLPPRNPKSPKRTQEQEIYFFLSDSGIDIPQICLQLIIRFL